MFCPNCGANNDNAARHCSQCGTALYAQVQPPPQPAPVYPPPAQPGPVYGAVHGAPLPEGTVPNYLVQSILVTLFCCLPLGIVGIVRSSDVNKRLAVGDYEGALSVSKSIRTMLWIGFGVSLFIGGIYIIVLILAAIAGSTHPSIN